MKKLILFVVLMMVSLATAQLKGSGKIITKTFDYNNFNKVNFDDLDGKLEIEVGKPFGIFITIDDNLMPLLTVNENAENKQLTIALKGNRNNTMYIEDTKIKVTISMSYLIEVSNNGNSGLTVNNINSKNFKTYNPVNGSTILQGIVENLEVICKGNGTLNAKQLIAKNAIVKASGNGNVYVNVSESIIAKTSGNCTVINSGMGKI